MLRPDGVATLVQYDVANRVTLVRRGPSGNPVMQATYTYFDDNRVASVTYLGGASTLFTYDAARRLTVINHRQAGGGSFLRLTYAYTADDLPDSITEHAGLIQTGFTDFFYDARDRLIAETRTIGSPYTRAYEYDQGGNRTTMIDTSAQIEVQYHYDLENPSAYASKNNRLTYHDTISTAGGQSTLVSTTWYYYNMAGNPTYIVTKPVGSATYSATRFEYAKNGQAVTYVLGETWLPDGSDPDTLPDDYDVTFAREFRYDGGRARYLDRVLDVSAESGLMRNPPFYVSLADTWTDYDGDESYGDWTVSGSSAVEARSFELGLAAVDPFAANGPGNTKYFHADMIGTTRSMSAAGLPTQAAVYTALGEPINGTNHRYGYAGSWGYQSHGEIPFLHVGARYYDPASGRFLQRDPIGLWGGFNIYRYVSNTPTKWTDPSGYDAGSGMQPPMFGPPGKSPLDILEEVTEEGDRQGWSDKYRHYKVSRRVTEECSGGFIIILPVGLLKELWDNVSPPRDWKDSIGDMFYNAWGWLDGMGWGPTFGASKQ